MERVAKLRSGGGRRAPRATAPRGLRLAAANTAGGVCRARASTTTTTLVRRRRKLSSSEVVRCRSQSKSCRVASVEIPTEEQVVEAPEDDFVESSSGSGSRGDPYEDEPWSKLKWTVYRGTAYDMTGFMNRHPGGQWLLNLAVKRDCTALFESYHLRPEVAVKRLQMLPKLENFPIEAVPKSPYPNDSDFYNAVRDRVRREVFKGEEIRGAHRSGSEWAAIIIVAYSIASFALYVALPNVLTGILCGLGGAWLGLTVQHCGNHGAMSTKEWVNQALGLTDDLSGGSSLMWRYHHQVSHHIHCNDEEVDEDVFSPYPLLR